MIIDRHKKSQKDRHKKSKCEKPEKSEHIIHSPGRLVFYGFSNEAGQYVSEQCLVQLLYSSEGGPPTWSQLLFRGHVPLPCSQDKLWLDGRAMLSQLAPRSQMLAWGWECSHPAVHLWLCAAFSVLTVKALNTSPCLWIPADMF